MCTRGVARGGAGGGQSPPPPKFGRSVNPIQTRAGGRLCPSHYCQPPGFKKLSTPLCTVQRIQFHKSFLRLLWIFNFFFRLVDVCKSFFHFPISKYVLPSTLALPPCRCKFASVSIKKWLLSSSNIRQKKLAIWCGFLGRKILWSLLQNISSSKHSVLYHISQNKKDALKLHVTIKSDSCHKTFVSSNCTYISTIVVSYL